MELNTFSLDEYDCIGFDLDCTLAEYNYKELTKLIYDLLVNYLIKEKFYESDFLLKSYEEKYFLQKGLFMDFKRGNILKINENGEIVMATHGTVNLSEDQIVQQYGPEKTSSAFADFIKDPLLVINSSHGPFFRATLDYFDMACTLIFARIVDHLDEKSGGISTEYNFWPDILSGLNHMYNRKNFANGKSEFFLALKKDPSLYYKKWNSEKLLWLKEVKSKKFVFLLTGSFIDFAELTASYCIGENWKDYFDVVLCYARKPFFFFANHPFLNIRDNAKEAEVVKAKDMLINGIYSQGNWKELKAFISNKINKRNPKCLYIGDNLIQDVYSPVHFSCCHSVAVSPELNQGLISSIKWGSYFEANNRSISYWNYLIRNYAKICVSGLDIFIKRPLDFQYNCLKQAKSIQLDDLNGYYKS